MYNEKKRINNHNIGKTKKGCGFEIFTFQSCKLSDVLDISPRYIAEVENAGQHPSLQVFYVLTTFLEISVDELLFPDKGVKKSTQRRQLDGLLDGVSDKGLRIITATTKEIKEIEKEGE